jgi:phosphodiesterase/alkaline phosphatase D-like protein
MLGDAQERWLMDGLSTSTARWITLANQVAISRIDNEPGPGERYSMDRWDGYVAARRRLTRFLAGRRPSNPIVLTGDIHTNWVGEPRDDFEDPESTTVGVEFIGTSLSSGGDGSDSTPLANADSPPTRRCASSTTSAGTSAARSHPTRGHRTIASWRTYRGRVHRSRPWPASSSRTGADGWNASDRLCSFWSMTLSTSARPPPVAPFRATVPPTRNGALQFSTTFRDGTRRKWLQVHVNRAWPAYAA